MRCPYCSARRDRVIDSRDSEKGAAIRRRRECLECGRRWTTYERPEEQPMMVVKKDDRREMFDRRKLMGGLLKACEKRPVPLRALERIADEIQALVGDQPERELSTRVIGQHVMERLRELDGVAYVRFASVYREFRDVDDFMEELRALGTRGGGGGRAPGRDAGEDES
ncbi:MAG: transcriptional repressor NrdR [Acidobacteria bacterium]|nr:MAG: transcriptional repressor NrdR [Acidobacteriota bacterium]